MSVFQRVDCADGTIEVSQTGDEITLRSASNPRMPTSLRLTSAERQQLIDVLRASIDGGSWSVWRQGDDGNAFMMACGLDQDAADKMVQNLELHKHMQLFWASQHVQVGQVSASS